MIVAIIPARNAEEYVEEAVKSIATQVDLVLVSDDGSIDDTAVIARNSADNVQVIHSSPHNQYHAKNAALQCLRKMHWPSYIAFLDADDIAYPDRISRQMELMNSDQDIWAVGGACHNITESGKSIAGLDIPAWPMNEDPMIKGTRSFGIGLWNATALYRSDVFDALGYFDYTPAMGDSEFFLRLVWATELLKKKCRNLKEPVIKRRIHPNQVTNTVAKSMFRIAYQKYLTNKFTYLKTLHKLEQLKINHLYTGFTQ